MGEFVTKLALIIISVLLAGVIIPTFAWLVREVLALRRDFTARAEMLDERWRNKDEQCIAHGEALKQGASLMQKTNNNVVRLCQKVGVDFES